MIAPLFALHRARAAVLVATLAAGVLAGPGAFAQAPSGDARSTPGQSREASTPGRTPTTESRPASARDERSTPGATNDARSTTGRTGADARSAGRAPRDDARSTAPAR